MLRISAIDELGQTTTFRLEGRVIGPWVNEVRRVCVPLLAGQGALTLDLADVSFIDAEGLALFRELQRSHVSFTNCSPFVAEQLRRGFAE